MPGSGCGTRLLHREDLVAGEEAVTVCVNALKLLAGLGHLVLVVTVLLVGPLALQRLGLLDSRRDGGGLHDCAQEEEQEQQEERAAHGLIG